MRLSRILPGVLTLLIVLTSIVGPALAQDDEALPLAEPGPYAVGVTTLTFIDENRDGREVVTEIWYPAIIPEGEGVPEGGLRDAEPDTSGTPYPLILGSHGGGSNRLSMAASGSHLASHGFVAAAMNHAGDILTDRPLDMLFVLDQLAAIDEGPLVDVIDTDHVGIAGGSKGGYTVFALTGARIDPDYYLEWCTDHSDRICQYGYPGALERARAYREQFYSFEEGELWPAMSDERILAALAAPPEEGRIFGQRGWAAATVPLAIMVGTLDNYEDNAAFVYENLGSEDSYLYSFVNEGHMFAYRANIGPIVFHLMTAFFGYYLQENEDYAEYLTPEFIEQFEDVVWGVYEEE